jgi:hypothetical protein
MAEPSIVQGLFGTTPEAYQQQQQRQTMQDALAMAQLDPMQLARANLMAGSNRVAGGVAGLMGVEDPQMRLISLRNALARQFDTNTPQGLMQYSNALQSAGDVQGAALAADRYRAIQGALIEQSQKAATAQKTITETAGLNVAALDRTARISQLMTKFNLSEDEASTIASNPDLVKQYFAPKTTQGFELLKTGKFTPESIANWSSGSGTLELVDMTTKPSEDWLKTARELGLPAKKTFNDYTPEQVAEVNKLELTRNLNLKTASAPKTTVDTNLPGLLAQIQGSEEARKQGDIWAKAGDLYKSQIGLTKDLSDFRKIAPDAFTGAGASTLTNLSRVLGAVGVPISEKASNTEYLEALKSSFVQKIARNFPGSQALKELEQLILSQPNVSQQLPTIMRLISRGLDEAKAETATYEKLAALPETERYKTNANIVYGKVRNEIDSYRTIEQKALKGQATKDEALKAKELKERLGL